MLVLLHHERAVDKYAPEAGRVMMRVGVGRGGGDGGGVEDGEVGVVSGEEFAAVGEAEGVRGEGRHSADGREIILVRQPMGLEQYEVDGRPDGRRVQGMETLLDVYRARLHAVEPTQAVCAFQLTSRDCIEIFHEASAFYHRLTFLFRLRDWTRVQRDAAQVLCLLEFARQHARCAEDRVQLEPWRPHLTRIQAVARAMMLLDQNQCREAWQIARGVIGLPVSAEDGAPDREKLAQALLETVHEALVTRPALHPHEESSFIRHDDFWTISYQGHTAFLKCTRGLPCLALLLRTPGREFHVSELLASLPEAPATMPANGRHHEDGTHLVVASLYDGAAILDTQAKAECKQRLHELRQETEEAERFNDPARAAKAREERDAIAHHLATAIGLGGRDRKTSSEAERARCAVTKRLKQAIQKIAEATPSLGHHLTARIKTGYFCSYNPHPDRPVAWKF